MNRRLLALGLLFALTLSLCACASPETGFVLNGKKTAYSDSIAYATHAWGGVNITETDGEHSLKNQTAQLNFGRNTEGLESLISLQTGETILQNTVVTTLSDAVGSGAFATVTWGEETTVQGNYGVSHARTGSVCSPSSLSEAKPLKDFDLTAEDSQAVFSDLAYEVTAEKSENGLKITSLGKALSQFGARYLGLELGDSDHYYLSLTLRAENISGLECYFSTDTVPLTEETLLGTIDLSGVSGSEFVTLTAPIENNLWKGILQTLLFRLPKGEKGTVEVSRVTLLTLNDTVENDVFESLWTVYSDRIYFTQTLNQPEISFNFATTEIALPSAKCTDLQTQNGSVALTLIDGSVLGFVLFDQGKIRTETTDGVTKIFFDWNLKETKALTLRVYLNYTDSLNEFKEIAKQERNPLSEHRFRLREAVFQGYDPKGGMYRIAPSADTFEISLKKTDRPIYLYLESETDAAWCVYDKKGNQLPIFAGTTFPLYAKEGTVTVKLARQSITESVEMPSFFAKEGLIEQSRSQSIFHGLCAQNTTRYAAPDGSYEVSLTATRLKDGTHTIYDVEYRFLDEKSVSDGLQTLPLFSFETEYGFEEYYYLNSENETVTSLAGSESVIYLGSTPYLGLLSEGSADGFLIADGQMTMSGAPSTAHLCLRYEEIREGEPNKMILSFDLNDGTFIRGDILTARIIQAHEGTSNEQALKTLRDQGNFRLIQTEDKNTEAITGLGMEESVIVCIEGFDRYQFPEITADGAPFTPTQYQVYVDKNGYYGFAFAVKNGTELKMK
ncbi:MAG: hypothetical protein IIV79_03125 [Clostridia bacterium]|nr:hypothetical protein [Clostridia bacterium]